MKERFPLFNGRLCSFLQRKLKTGLQNLYKLFGFANIKNKREPLSLLKRATGAICSCRSFKMSKKSESLSSVCTKRAKRAKRAICLHRSLKKSQKREQAISSFLYQKTSEEKPMSEVPTLTYRGLKVDQRSVLLCSRQQRLPYSHPSHNEQCTATESARSVLLTNNRGYRQ